MKKTYYFLVILLSLAIFTNGCKKEKNSGPTRIKTMTTGSFSDTFTYDNQNRILTLKPNGNLKTVFQYKGSDSIIVLQVNINTNDTTRLLYYLLNANGVATEQVQVGNNSNFVYDASNYKIYSRNTNAAIYTDSFYVSSGNVTQEISKYNLTGLSYSRTVSDYTLDSRTNTITNETNGMSFLGKSNTNLITGSQSVETYYSFCIFPPCAPPTITTKNFSYTYEFDSNNRVTKQIITNLANSSTTVTTYTYY